MTESKDPKGWVQLVKYLVDESPLRPVFAIVSVFLFVSVPIIMMLALIGTMKLAISAINDPSVILGVRKCLELQEISGETYIVDNCKGTVKRAPRQ